MNPFIDKRHDDITPFFDTPMPREEFMRKELQEFAKKFAICTFAALLFAGIVYPWKHELAQVPFWLMFLGGAWLLTTRRTQ